jgi:hypothetical protein
MAEDQELTENLNGNRKVCNSYDVARGGRGRSGTSELNTS